LNLFGGGEQIRAVSLNLAERIAKHFEGQARAQSRVPTRTDTPITPHNGLSIYADDAAIELFEIGLPADMPAEDGHEVVNHISPGGSESSSIADGRRCGQTSW